MVGWLDGWMVGWLEEAGNLLFSKAREIERRNRWNRLVSYGWTGFWLLWLDRFLAACTHPG